MPLGFCFYIAPIGEEDTPERMQSDTVQEYVVVPALADRYVIKRADEDALPGLITHQIIRDIHRADLIVCDLTGLNPNVMYELCFAHTLAKPVIVLAGLGTRLPFDLVNVRTIFMDLRGPKGHQKACAQVRAASNALREARRISNPITDTLDGLAPDDLSRIMPFGELQNLLKEIGPRLAALEARLSGSGAVAVEPGEKTGAGTVRSPVRDGPARQTQIRTAGRIISAWRRRPGFERVAVDRGDPCRLIVYGDARLDTAKVAEMAPGFDIQFRLDPILTDEADLGGSKSFGSTTLG